MFSPSILTGLTPANGQEADATGPAFPAAASPGDGPSFGQVLLQTQGQPGADWQNLADAPSSPKGLLDASEASRPTPLQDELTALSLGPHLQIITTVQPAADPQSLQAFARAQGLSEAAVQWLFGPRPASGPGAGDTASATTPFGTTLAGMPAFTQAETATTAPSSVSTLLAARLSASAPGLEPAPQLASADAEGLQAQAPPAALALRMALAADTPAGSGHGQSLTAPAGQSEGEQLAMALQARAQASAGQWASGRTLRQAQANPDAPAWSQAGTTQAAMTPMAKTLILNLDTFEIAEVDSPAEGTAPPLLDTEGSELGVARAPTSGQEARSGTGHTGSDKATGWSSQLSRSDNIEALAERMGKAIGERLKSEFDRGQWHLRMLLQPGRLGEVQIEMKLGQGGLEAQFVSTQASTRDLLQDSLGRLRDTLQQLGMNVASLQVGGEAARQRGGDPTPQDMGARQQPHQRAQGLAAEPTHSPAASLPRMGDGGWDVVV